MEEGNEMRIAIDLLMKSLANCPRYTREEEAALCVRMRDGDDEAKQQLFLSCAPWAISWGQRFVRSHFDLVRKSSSPEGVVQCALWGLFDAVERFDAAKFGTRLTTYATYHMRKQCMGAMRSNGVIMQPYAVWFKPNTNGNIARRPVFSLAADYDQAADCNRRTFNRDDIEELRDEIKHLDEREQDILKLRYWGGHTLLEVGKMYNLSRERIRQIQAGAVRKLRELMR